jgi:hypothetical protein
MLKSTPCLRSFVEHVQGEFFEDRGIEDGDFISKRGDSDAVRSNKQVCICIHAVILLIILER